MDKKCQLVSGQVGNRPNDAELSNPSLGSSRERGQAPFLQDRGKVAGEDLVCKAENETQGSSELYIPASAVHDRVPKSGILFVSPEEMINFKEPGQSNPRCQQVLESVEYLQQKHIVSSECGERDAQHVLRLQAIQAVD